MAIQRSLMAGGTNYLGATLDDILSHLEDWRSGTEETIDDLKGARIQVGQNREHIADPDDVIEFIDVTINQLSRFKIDFKRLLTELPLSVEARHPEIVLRLAQFAKVIDDHCLDFRREHINRGMKDEGQRPLIDKIYATSRNQAIDYIDLFNLADQLQTFVGTRPEARFDVSDVDALELKPNVFGIGINVNHIIKRFKKWIGR